MNWYPWFIFLFACIVTSTSDTDTRLDSLESQPVQVWTSEEICSGASVDLDLQGRWPISVMEGGDALSPHTGWSVQAETLHIPCDIGPNIVIAWMDK